MDVYIPYLQKEVKPTGHYVHALVNIGSLHLHICAFVIIKYKDKF